MPETLNSTEPCIYCFLYTYIPMIKLIYKLGKKKKSNNNNGVTVTYVNGFGAISKQNKGYLDTRTAMPG